MGGKTPDDGLIRLFLAPYFADNVRTEERQGIGQGCARNEDGNPADMDAGIDMPNVILLLSDNSQSVSKLLAGASRATDTLLVITMGEGLYKNLLTSYVKT